MFFPRRIMSYLLSLFCCLLISAALVSQAEDSSPNAAKLYAQATDLKTQADHMLQGNPKTKDYYLAAKLYYAAAALLRETAQQNPQTDPTAQTFSVNALQTQAKKLDFQAGECHGAAVDRETRGLP